MFLATSQQQLNRKLAKRNVVQLCFVVIAAVELASVVSRLNPCCYFNYVFHLEMK